MALRLRLPQRRQTLDFEELTPFEQAVARFNESEAGQTVCGLVRTLGDPRVSVGAAAGSDAEVRVTVAWELSWYQWGVDVGAGESEVHELAKGREIAEIDYAARQWNAAATADGRIVVAVRP
jgi:hypothetical protein